jgi:hypothetical protein
VGLLLLILGGLAAPAPVAAQQSTDSLRAEVARLAALVDSLSHEVARLRDAGKPQQAEQAQDALAKLRAAAQAAATAGGAPAPKDQPEEQEFVGQQRSLQRLNPEISVNSDGFVQVNKDATGEDNFFMRAFEIAIAANLDPYSRAKIFLVRDQPGGELEPFGSDGEHEEPDFVPEEGYVEWVALPGGLGLKLGRFFQQFGQLNRWHQHALPVQSRSLPHIAFLGQEPLGATGASLHWLLPFGGGSGTYETTWEVTHKETESLFGNANGVSVLGNFNAFWNLSEALDLDLSLNWLNGGYRGDGGTLDRTLYGVEAALTWRPPGRSKYREFKIRGGMMLLDGLLGPDGAPRVDPGGPETAKGFWSISELRLNQSWIAGARVDWTENPLDPSQTAWLASPTLTWWQSEFVRLRLEYDLMGRSFEAGNEGRLLLQATFAMGPHKHESY